MRRSRPAPGAGLDLLAFILIIVGLWTHFLGHNWVYGVLIVLALVAATLLGLYLYAAWDVRRREKA